MKRSKDPVHIRRIKLVAGRGATFSSLQKVALLLHKQADIVEFTFKGVRWVYR